MRTLRFRGISLDTNKWVYGYGVIQHPDGLEASIIHKQGINETQHTAVEPKTLGQFTGLVDKNGKEIYESDIIKYDWKRGKTKSGTVITDVYWDNVFRIRKNETILTDIAVLRVIASNAEVIGTIYETPELLEP